MADLPKYYLTQTGAETQELLDSIGTDTLETEAQTLTGAVNEVLSFEENNGTTIYQTRLELQSLQSDMATVQGDIAALKMLTSGSHSWAGTGAAISTSQVLIAFRINEESTPSSSDFSGLSASLTTVGAASSVTLDTTRTTKESLVFILTGSFTLGRAYYCLVNFTKA